MGHVALVFFVGCLVGYFLTPVVNAIGVALLMFLDLMHFGPQSKITTASRVAYAILEAAVWIFPVLVGLFAVKMLLRRRPRP